MKIVIAQDSFKESLSAIEEALQIVTKKSSCNPTNGKSVRKIVNNCTRKRQQSLIWPLPRFYAQHYIEKLAVWIDSFFMLNGNPFGCCKGIQTPLTI